MIAALASGGGNSSNTASNSNDTEQTQGDNSSNDPTKSHSANSEHKPQDDITIDECTTDDITGPEASGVIENHSSKRSNYMVEISFEDASGVKIGSGTDYVDNVDPGQKAKWKAVSLGDSADQVTCKIANVDRFAS